MTEMTTAPSPTETPLAALLASAERPPEFATYHGVLTPLELDARASEIAALVSGVAVHDLGWLQRVEVRGEDRFRWLSGMVTNTVKDLSADSGAWNLVLNAQGRIQGDLMVWRESPRRQESESAEPGEDKIELEIDSDQYDRLLAHLDRFIIMDDVELAGLDPTSETAIGLTGPGAGELLGQMGLARMAEPMTTMRAVWNGISLLIRRGFGVLAEHYVIWTPTSETGALWKALTEAGGTPVGSKSLEAFRIAEGIPAYGIDMVERDLPQETSQMRALSFSKGCYLGQEIVERIRSRGNVHRHLCSLELDGPVPARGADLTLQGTTAGHFTSAAALPLAGGARVFALGMIRGEAAELRNQPLNYNAAEGEGTARILAVPPTFDLEGMKQATT
jgi:folate-binding protein YgfZ